MSGTGVALRYAAALYEVAEANNQRDAVARDMEAVRRIIEEVPGLQEYCRRESVAIDDAVTMAQTAFVPYVNELTARMLLAAVHNGRLEALPLLASAYERITEARSDAVSVMLEGAVEPDDETVRTITAKMRSRIGRDVVVHTRVVPELVAGIRIVWMDRVIDLSAAARVKRLRSQLVGAPGNGTEHGA